MCARLEALARVGVRRRARDVRSGGRGSARRVVWRAREHDMNLSGVRFNLQKKD
jgi:hypothetical protein